MRLLKIAARITETAARVRGAVRHLQGCVDGRILQESRGGALAAHGAMRRACVLPREVGGGGPLAAGRAALDGEEAEVGRVLEACGAGAGIVRGVPPTNA